MGCKEMEHEKEAKGETGKKEEAKTGK